MVMIAINVGSVEPRTIAVARAGSIYLEQDSLALKIPGFLAHKLSK
jgi:hypothetical protein